VLVTLLIGYAAQFTWRRVNQLGEHLSEAQIESFQTADQFRANLQQLNYLLLRQEIQRNPADWDRFMEEWKQLDRWIDRQRPRLTTAKERNILDQINAAYDDYFTAATALVQAPENPANTSSRLAAYQKLDHESRRLLALGYQLVGAHRESLTKFLADSQRSLVFFRGLIFGALTLLLLLMGSLSMVVYREMIQPLNRKLLESRAIIERQEKLASLGLLAAGVAHEIRNPLTAIKARLFTQQKLLKTGSPERADSEVIGSEINRLEQIVKDFLQFARPSDPRLSVVSPESILRETQSLLAPQLEKTHIRIQTETGGAALAISADPQQLKQILINLIQNAADSIEREGLITLRARGDIRRLNGADVDAVILEVEDTGKGIPPAAEKRLFDPFFSTKEDGTGLGLSIAARIVERHGGTIEYQTTLNRGTIFAIVLPRAKA